MENKLRNFFKEQETLRLEEIITFVDIHDLGFFLIEVVSQLQHEVWCVAYSKPFDVIISYQAIPQIHRYYTIDEVSEILQRLTNKLPK